MHFVIFQHLDIEPPALIAELLLEQGHRLSIIHLDQGEPLPQSINGIEGVIIMGGPQSANDTHLPYIRQELAWLQKAIADGLPMLGICLGAQLMAGAAGAEIGPSPARELGWYPIYPAGADPLFASLPAEGLAVFQWHGETFTLPAAATLVATHPDVPQQAFRLGKSQYGLQFHVEVTEQIIEDWIEAGDSERTHLGQEGIKMLRHQTPIHLPAMQAFCREMTLAWLKSIER